MSQFWKAKIKALTGLVPAEAYEGRFRSKSLPLPVDGYLLLVSLYIVFPLCVSLSYQGTYQISPFCKDSSHTKRAKDRETK